MEKLQFFTDFWNYEKVEHKKNNLKSDIDFLNNCKQLGVYPNFFIFKLPNVSNKDTLSVCKRLLQVAPSISVIKNSNIFQTNSLYPKTFILTAFYYWLLHPYKIYNIAQQKIAVGIVICSTRKFNFTDNGLQLTYIHS